MKIKEGVYLVIANDCIEGDLMTVRHVTDNLCEVCYFSSYATEAQKLTTIDFVADLFRFIEDKGHLIERVGDL